MAHVCTLYSSLCISNPYGGFFKKRSKRRQSYMREPDSITATIARQCSRQIYIGLSNCLGHLFAISSFGSTVSNTHWKSCFSDCWSWNQDFNGASSDFEDLRIIEILTYNNFTPLDFSFPQDLLPLKPHLVLRQHLLPILILIW